MFTCEAFHVQLQVVEDAGQYAFWLDTSKTGTKYRHSLFGITRKQLSRVGIHDTDGLTLF